MMNPPPSYVGCVGTFIIPTFGGFFYEFKMNYATGSFYIEVLSGEFYVKDNGISS
jgi:hypothetical protein